MNWKSRVAGRIADLAPSVAATEILKLAERPDIISFAGGLPDPRSFPLEPIRESVERVLHGEAPEALNYGPGPGYTRLRDWIAERMANRYGVRVSRDHILVSSGGVEALNLISMALLNPGDTVVVGAPTYLIALHVFRASQARIVTVDLDEKGLSTDALEEKLADLEAEGVQPKLLYVIPSFQNPTGLTLSADRRRRLVEIGERFDIPIVEDHAYAELRYEGDPLPSLKSLAPDRVLLIQTFSKIFAPGVRLGWVAADPDLIQVLGLCKIGTDSCANTFAQRLVYDYGSRGGMDRQVAGSIDLYRRKRDLLLQSLAQELCGLATWTKPQGGFYVWVTLGEGADSEALLRHAISQEKTAFVAGPPFYADRRGRRQLRLAFSFVPEEQIAEGCRRLGRAVRAVARPAT